jgi:predicted alpha/beta hydrolase family esterase
MGSPASNWFPWLKHELEACGHTVAVPTFPTPQGQSLEAWRTVANGVLEKSNPAQTILVGHSIGATFALRIAENAVFPFKAVFAVAPFAHDLGLAPYDQLNASFTRPPFDWDRVREKAGHISCFAGNDDPYVPLAYAKEVADGAGVALTVIAKGGHLNAESGYLEFPLLLNEIRQTCAA